MSSTASNILTQGTINGLSNLELSSLSTDSLISNNIKSSNINGNYFSIDVIEALNVRVDKELNLTNDGFIIVGKDTINQVVITDTQLAFLEGLSENIQDNLDLNANALLIDDIQQNKDDIVTLYSGLDTHGILISNNGNAIDSNYGFITTNTANITTNASNISTNTANLVTVFSALDTYSILISNNANATDSNYGLITTNTNNISTNASNISTNTANLVTVFSALDTHSILISNNGNAIDSNYGLITTNSSNISANSSNISGNSSNISVNSSNISTNTSNISANTSNISANTSNISTNASNISANANDISANTSNISTNAGNISTNDSNITANTSSINAIKQKTDLMTKHGGNDITFDDGISSTWLSANYLVINGSTQNHAYIDSDYNAVQTYKSRVIIPTFSLSNGWSLVGRTTEFTPGGYFNDNSILFITQLPELSSYVDANYAWNYGSRTIRVHFSVDFRSYGSALHVFKTQIRQYKASSSSYNSSLYNGTAYKQGYDFTDYLLYDGEFLCEMHDGDSLSLKTEYIIGVNPNNSKTINVQISITEV